MQAMAAKDVATLEAVLADDLIYTHSSARLDTKKSLIGHDVGTTVYTSVEPSDVKAQDLGDTVVLTGIAQIKVVSNGTPNAFGVRFTDVYAKRNGRWQMVTWQSTRLPAYRLEAMTESRSPESSAVDEGPCRPLPLERRHRWHMYKIPNMPELTVPSLLLITKGRKSGRSSCSRCSTARPARAISWSPPRAAHRSIPAGTAISSPIPRSKSRSARRR